MLNTSLLQYPITHEELQSFLKKVEYYINIKVLTEKNPNVKNLEKYNIIMFLKKNVNNLLIKQHTLEREKRLLSKKSELNTEKINEIQLQVEDLKALILKIKTWGRRRRIKV